MSDLDTDLSEELAHRRLPCWLIDFAGERHVMAHFATPEEAIAQWSRSHISDGCFVKISKLSDSREFRVTRSFAVEPA